MRNEKKEKEVNQEKLVKNHVGKFAKLILLLAVILLFTVLCFTIGIAYSNNEKEPTCRQSDKYSNHEKEPTCRQIDKPVVYLYPEKDNTPVSVNIDYDETLMSVYPSFTENNTWKVTADKNGILHKDGKQYNYLFWEGKNSKTDWDFSTGFCVKGKDTANFLEDTLIRLGLNDKETNDFIVYWIETGAMFLIFAIIITATYILAKSERKAIESAYNEGMDIYIDGEPVSDEFDIKGIDLDKYNIKIEDDILYLTSK